MREKQMDKAQGISLYCLCNCQNYITLEKTNLEKNGDEHNLKISEKTKDGFWSRLWKACAYLFKKKVPTNDLLVSLTELEKAIVSYKKGSEVSANQNNKFLSVGAKDITTEDPILSFTSLDVLTIRGRGLLYLVENPKDCEKFDWLVGRNIIIDGNKYYSIGVESFKYAHKYHRGEHIGILVAKAKEEEEDVN